jgi:7,8-dihydropterin-6-yl-methyl-4-(beta-D-ribofuranosyl)aminobenzene 5'-phosphate synthase
MTLLDRRVDLEPVDSLEVLVVMDNFSDVLLPSTERVRRPPLARDGQIPATTLLAEHGLSLLITARSGSVTSRVLLDAGYSEAGVPHNLDLLGVDLSDVEALVLSHGHMDHFGALGAVLERMGGGVPVVTHPSALEGSRYLERADSDPVRFADLPRWVVDSIRGRSIVTSRPYVSPTRLWATTGEIERRTDFERGMPGAMRQRDGELVTDALEDDLAIVAVVRGKGLAIISGCAHSGIVNTVRHAQEITGVDAVDAVVGGFHLSGAAFADAVDPTVAALKGLGPRMVVPMHCTGRSVTQLLESVLPDAFELSSVGTTFIV